MANYVKISFRSKKISTIKDLLKVEGIINITPAKFLDERNPETNVTNRDALFNAYSEQQKKELGIKSSKDINEGTTIYPPAVLWCSIDNVKKELIKIDSQFTSVKDYDAFLSENIKKIVNSDFYVKSEFTKVYPKCQVFIWCKALEKLNKGATISLEEINGDIINITDYVEQINTNVSESGGNFTIRLPFLPGKQSNPFQTPSGTGSVNIWQLNEANIHNTVVKETINEVDKIQVHGGTIPFRKEVQTTKNDLRRENFLQNAISVNDIVFIKMERLDIEKREGQDTYPFYISNEKLVDEYYDMIGLIDNVSVPTNPQDVSIELSGRDLMKLVLDDGTFFFGSSFSKEDRLGGVFNNLNKEVDGASATNVLLNRSERVNSRLIAAGYINEFFMATEASKIGKLIETLIKTLSNIQICPDSVFEPYQRGHNEDDNVVDKRTKFQKKEETATSSKK